MLLGTNTTRFSLAPLFRTDYEPMIKILEELPDLNGAAVGDRRRRLSRKGSSSNSLRGSGGGSRGSSGNLAVLAGTDGDRRGRGDGTCDEYLEVQLRDMVRRGWHRDELPCRCWWSILSQSGDWSVDAKHVV